MKGSKCLTFTYIIVSTIYIYTYRVNKKRGLAAFWPILVIFFQNDMAANIIKKIFFNVLEIQKTFENKKGANFEFIVKSQCLILIILDSFLQNDKNPLTIFRGFSSISPCYCTESK